MQEPAWWVPANPKLSGGKTELGGAGPERPRRRNPPGWPRPRAAPESSLGETAGRGRTQPIPGIRSGDVARARPIGARGGGAGPTQVGAGVEGAGWIGGSGVRRVRARPAARLEPASGEWRGEASAVPGTRAARGRASSLPWASQPLGTSAGLARVPRPGPRVLLGPVTSSQLAGGAGSLRGFP